MRGDAVFEWQRGSSDTQNLYRFQKSRGTASMGIRSGGFSDVEIGIRAAGERSLWLTVRVNQGEELLYERTGRVELLNVPFMELEGSKAAEGPGSLPRRELLIRRSGT